MCLDALYAMKTPNAKKERKKFWVLRELAFHLDVYEKKSHSAHNRKQN